MKSFPSEIKLHGLKPYASAPRDSGYTINCKGVKAEAWGLAGYTPDIVLFPTVVYGSGTLDLSIDWPFPQIFQTDTGLWIGKRDGLYQLVWTGSGYSATQIAAVWTRWPWTLAACPMFPVFSSGDALVYYDYDSSAWICHTRFGGTVGAHWNGGWLPPMSVCFVNGQIVTVGAAEKTTAPSQSRIVRWSEIGKFRFLGQTARVESNEAGFMYAERDDDEILLRCLPLKKRIIVYGTFGVFGLRPEDSVAPTFAIEWYKRVGIVNPLAVGGSNEKHVMVDREGYIWELSTNIYNMVQMEKKGYADTLGQMQKEVEIGAGKGMVCVVYNDQEEEFYISDGDSGFIYTDSGLTQTEKNLTSFVDYKNAMVTNLSHFVQLKEQGVGFYADNGDETVYLQTDVLNLGMDAIKAVETVEVLGTLPVDAKCEVMVESRVQRTGQFRETKWVRVNSNGVASPIVAGTELRVNVRISSAEGLTLEGLRLWWKLVDKRGVRGNYVGTVTSGSGK